MISDEGLKICSPTCKGFGCQAQIPAESCLIKSACVWVNDLQSVPSKQSALPVCRKDYSGEYTIYLIPCTVQPTQPWVDPGEKPLACTAHAPER